MKGVGKMELLRDISIIYLGIVAFLLGLLLIVCFLERIFR